MGQDVRFEMMDQFAQAQKLIKQECEIKLQATMLLGQLHRQNAAVNLGMYQNKYIEALGLTPDQYYKRIAAYRVLIDEPCFQEMLRNGETYLSHLAMIAPKLTSANSTIIVEGVRGKTKREVAAFLSTVSAEGKRLEQAETVEIRLTLTKEQLELLERARDVLAARGKCPSEQDTLLQGLNDLLVKRDPMEKAKRAVARQHKKNISAPSVSDAPNSKLAPALTPPKAAGNRTSLGERLKRQRLPNLATHLIWLRDHGQCTHVDREGSRCGETRMLEIDHIKPVCRGGGNGMENLRLLCRAHNQHAARKLLGDQFVGPR